MDFFFCLLAFVPPGPSQSFCLAEPDPPEDAGLRQQPHQQDPGAAALAGGAQVEPQQAQLAPPRQFQRCVAAVGEALKCEKSLVENAHQN